MGVTPCSVPILQTVFEVTGTYELPRQKPLLNRCVPLIPLESSNQEDQLWPLLPQAKPILARRRGPNSTTFGHHPFIADVAGLTGRKFRWRSIERLAYSAASRKRKPYSCCAPNLKSLFPKASSAAESQDCEIGEEMFTCTWQASSTKKDENGSLAPRAFHRAECSLNLA
jgi:hypothetical protein